MFTKIKNKKKKDRRKTLNWDLVEVEIYITGIFFEIHVLRFKSPQSRVRD